MRKRFIKRAGLLAGLAAVMMAAAGCNRTLEAKFAYDAGEYIKLGEYKNLEVSVDREAIEKKIVDAKIDENLKAYTQYSEVNRGAQEGDRVTLTFYGKIAGQTIDGFSNEDYTYEVGSGNTVIEGFDDAVKGMTAGEFKIAILKVSDDFTENTEYTGATIVYEITCSSVKAPVLPQITDAWVKANLNYDTYEAYEESVKQSVQSSIESGVYDAKYEEVVKKLLKNTTIIKEPEELQDELNKKLSKSMTYFATMYKMSLEQYCINNYGVTYDEYVKSASYYQLIYQAIVKAENITIDDYYYKDHLDEFVKKYGDGQDAASYVAEYGKEYIVNMMLVDKAIETVVQSAVIK